LKETDEDLFLIVFPLFTVFILIIDLEDFGAIIDLIESDELIESCES